MKETERIIGLFNDLYQGKPWLDVTITGTLASINAGQAVKKVSPGWNSIWEIVNHLISWRLAVLERVQSAHTKTPEDNYFKPVTDPSPAAWKNTLNRFEDTQLRWISFLKSMNETDFEKIYQPNSLNYYQHIHGILQHDAYHLGQIVMLAKLPE
jgi:uncharacterized damage-inducible protein DinB